MKETQLTLLKKEAIKESQDRILERVFDQEKKLHTRRKMTKENKCDCNYRRLCHSTLLLKRQLEKIKSYKLNSHFYYEMGGELICSPFIDNILDDMLYERENHKTKALDELFE